jgi:pimeloyl-ACP methyl ester carboxylesterase
MKKYILKIFKILAITLLAIFLVIAFYVFFTGPKLPENTDEIVKKVISSELPEFIKGKADYIRSGDLKIWYESITPSETSKGTILLFMGISNDALAWPQSFIDKLVNSGYQVVRYDYRGTGLSDWVENWKEKPYSLADLANDAKIIMDSLKIKSANLVGVSMGGMVAQEFAINFPERTLSLTSIMSSGNIIDEKLPPISKKVVLDLVKTGIKYGIGKSDTKSIILQLAAREILKGKARYDLDIKLIAEQVLYNMKKRKGFNPLASEQHHEATYRSGSRYEKLKNLKIPVLIIHGTDDPFIPIEHSKKLASVIPHSKTKWFKNMGHDFPPVLEDSIVFEIDNLIKASQSR